MPAEGVGPPYGFRMMGTECAPESAVGSVRVPYSVVFPSAARSVTSLVRVPAACSVFGADHNVMPFAGSSVPLSRSIGAVSSVLE